MGEWRDTASVTDLLDFSPGDQHEVAELVRTDGLLTIHGEPDRASGPLDHEYRWLHRSIHEHLAAEYLAKIITADRAAGRNAVRAAALRPDWLATLEYVAAIMNQQGLDLLFDHLEAISADGDPGQWIQRVTDRLADTLTSTSRHGVTLFDRAIQRRAYDIAYRIDPAHTISEIRNSVGVIDWSSVSNICGPSHEPLPPDILESVALNAPEPHNRTPAIRELFRVYPGRAHDTMVAIVKNSRNRLPTLELTTMPHASVQWIVDQIRNSPWNIALQIYVACAANNRPADVGLENRPLLRGLFSMLLERDMNGACRNLPNIPGWEVLVSGDKGAEISYRAGHLCQPDKLVEASPWALLGSWVSTEHMWDKWSHLLLPWDVDRAIEALHVVCNRDKLPTVEALIAASISLHWLAFHPAGEAVPYLIDLARVGHELQWERYRWESEAVRSLLPPIGLAVRAMSAKKFIKYAVDKIRKKGWTMVEMELLSHTRNGRSFEAALELATSIQRHNIPVHTINMDFIRGIKGGKNIFALQDIARSATSRAARTSIANLTVELLPGPMLEDVWPTLIDILNQ